MKEVGRRWKSLGPEDKQVFEGKAKEDKKRFDKEMEKFSKEINKVNIFTSEDKKKTKGSVKKSKSKKSKSKIKKKIKRSADTQADYYYPGKNYENKQGKIEKPKNDYSLRRRSRKSKSEMMESVSGEESEEGEDDDIDEDIEVPHKISRPLEEEKFPTPSGIPKKPLSSYIFFSQKIRDEIKKQNPKLPINQLMKEISHRWQSISDNEKQPFHTMAQNDKNRYEHEMMQYKQNMRSNQKDEMSEIEPIERSNSRNEFISRPMYPINEQDYYRSRDMRDVREMRDIREMRDMRDMRDMRPVQPPRRASNSTIPINVVPDSQSNNSQAIRSKKERRTKKNFDYPSFRVPIEQEEFLNPSNTDYMENRSGMSINNRMAANEDKATERSRQDSMQFAFNEDEDKE